MSKRGTREHYDAEFKREAVGLLLTSGKTATQLSRELGVSAWSLSRWKQEELRAMGEITVDGQVRPAAEVEQENRQLRHELEAMRRQRDLLKKAIAICSEDGLGQDALGVERVRGMK
ncbi:MAG: transposase [Acidobacteria bacterium]|nr:transposase [Acidobacteriota bacterium]